MFQDIDNMGIRRTTRRESSGTLAPAGGHGCTYLYDAKRDRRGRREDLCGTEGEPSQPPKGTMVRGGLDLWGGQIGWPIQ